MTTAAGIASSTTSSPPKSSSCSSSSISAIINSTLKLSQKKEINQKKQLRRQLYLILALRCLRCANLCNPILVPFLSSSSSSSGGNGGGGGPSLSPPDILYLGSLYSLLVILAEMPSGYMSDVWGRKCTIQTAFICLSAGLICLGCSGIFTGGYSIHTPFSIMGGSMDICYKWIVLFFSQLFRASGSALFSGTDMALLYETLKRYGDLGRTQQRDSQRKQRQRIDRKKDEVNSDQNQEENDPKDSNSNSDEISQQIKEEVLAIESYHVFASAITEAIFSALGGSLSTDTMLGLRGAVFASSVPFCFSAFLCMFLEKDVENRSKSDDGDGEVSKQHSKETTGTMDKSTMETTTRKKSSKKGKIHLQLQRSFSSLIPSPGPLRNVIPIGVALNCATYIASTALNPLLWSSSGISTSYFGVLGAMNQCVSASSALFAPILKKWLLPSSEKREEESEESHHVKEVAMGKLLELLLFMAVSSYGLMALSASFIQNGGSMEKQHNSYTLSSTLAILGSIIMSCVRGLAWPVLGSAINGSIQDNSLRATALSLFAGMIKVGMVGTGLILGMVLKVEQTSDDGNHLENGGAVVVPGLRDACILCCGTLLLFCVYCGTSFFRISLFSSSSLSSSSWWCWFRRRRDQQQDEGKKHENDLLEKKHVMTRENGRKKDE